MRDSEYLSVFGTKGTLMRSAGSVLPSVLGPQLRRLGAAAHAIAIDRSLTHASERHSLIAPQLAVRTVNYVVQHYSTVAVPCYLPVGTPSTADSTNSTNSTMRRSTHVYRTCLRRRPECPKYSRSLACIGCRSKVTAVASTQLWPRSCAYIRTARTCMRRAWPTTCEPICCGAKRCGFRTLAML